MSVPPEVLHYVGYDDDRGGIVSVVRNLAATGRFGCVLGLNAGGRQTRVPALPVLELPRIAGERISPATLWRARAVARAVQLWLRGAPGRIFHGHSRAGLLVALWLDRFGERRVVASVHCYGRQRWFYRWAARRLDGRLFWLSPAMQRHYAAGGTAVGGCIPGGVAPSAVLRPAPVPGRLRLGGVGALVAWKCWHEVVAALAMLPAEARARVTFDHIGDGDPRYRGELLACVEATGLAAQVTLHGAEPSSARLLGTIDALVVASHQEPFSVALLEALAAGVPVIAANGGGAPDAIRPGVNGELFRPGDAAALAAILRRWLEQPVAWNPTAIQATTVTVEKVAAQWDEVYRGLE